MMDEPLAVNADPPRSIGTRMARGAAWMVAMRSGDRALGFVSMLVLARLLVPADFGLLALGMAVVGSLAAFSEFSFDMALIQNQTADRRHYDTAWTLGIVRGLLLTVILLIIAKPAAGVMGDERLDPLISVLAVVPLLEGLANIGVVEFRKQLVFSKEFHYTISSRIGGVLTTIALAFLWRDYWALVVGQLTVQVLRLVLSYGIHPYRPRLSLAAWRDLIHFSKWLFLNSIFAVVANRMPTFVIGAILSTSSVGLFAISAGISNLISQGFVAPIKRALFPAYSKISHDIVEIRQMYYRTHSLIILVSLPATLGIVMTSDIFVPLLLGEKWIDAVGIIEILSVNAILISCQGQVRPLLMATNRPHIAFYLSVLFSSVLAPAMLLGVYFAGVEGAAGALVGARLVEFIAEYIVLVRTIGLSFRVYINKTWRGIVASLVMGLAVFWTEGALPSVDSLDQWGRAFNLAIVVLTGCISYLSLALILWHTCGRPDDSAEGIVLALLRRNAFGIWNNRRSI